MRKLLKINKKSFTLIELLIVIGIIAVLMAIAIVAINPGRQFAKANNAKRWGDVNALGKAIAIRIIDGKGNWSIDNDCPPLPAIPGIEYSLKDPASCGAGENCYDICPCLVPFYFGSMPIDPTNGSGGGDCSAYDSGYSLERIDDRLKISAPYAQPENGINQDITFTVPAGNLAPYCQDVTSLCSDFINPDDCLSRDCTWQEAYCGGMCTSCADLNRNQCQQQQGCRWRGGRCRDNPICTSCDNFLNQVDCGPNIDDPQYGCFWEPAECLGDATPCRTYTTEEECITHSGCQWLIP